MSLSKRAQRRVMSLRRKRRLQLRRFTNWLKALPCEDCHCCFPPECMDFDHRTERGKTSDVSKGRNRWGLARLQRELMKCDIVCANCHRTRTERRRCGF